MVETSNNISRFVGNHIKLTVNYQGILISKHIWQSTKTRLPLWLQERESLQSKHGHRIIVDNA